MAKRIAANVFNHHTWRTTWSLVVQHACESRRLRPQPLFGEKEPAHTTWFKQQVRAIETIETWFQRSFRIRASFRSLNPAVLAVPFLPASRPIPPEVPKHFFRLAGTDFQLDTQTILQSRQRKQTLQYSNLVQVYFDYVLIFSHHFNTLTNSGSQSRDDS